MIDWGDPQSLLDAIIEAPDIVTPLMVERFLEHCGFEDLGTIPLAGAGRCSQWAPKERDQFRALRVDAVTVYQTEPVLIERIESILKATRHALEVYITCGARAPRLKFPGRPKSPEGA